MVYYDGGTVMPFSRDGRVRLLLRSVVARAGFAGFLVPSPDDPLVHGGMSATSGYAKATPASPCTYRL